MVVTSLSIRLVSVRVFDIKRSISRISVRFVIGKWFIVESVVVSTIKLLFVIFVVFLEESSNTINSVIWWTIFI